MKNLVLLLIVTGCIYIASCSKDSQSEAFKLLTGPTWASDSLLVNKVDASGPDGMLKNFKGEAKFNEDGTGNFGIYTGAWRFSNEETYIVLSSDSLQLPLSVKIAELTSKSLKVTTAYPNPANPTAPVSIRMTFKAKQ
jgi:hypothetical protein